MSLNGSGRYLRRYETRGSFEEEDGESPKVNFEPGSGAEFMYNAGWHNRDPYGNDLRPSRGNGSYEDDHGGYGMKFWLIIALGVVTFLLLSLAIIMAILFGTRVFIVNPGEALASTPLPVTGGIYDPVVNRTFNCQMLILNQANPAFANTNSPEYLQARVMLNNATSLMISQSTLAAYSAITTFDSMHNIGDDLLFKFHITITVPSRNAINASTIQGILLKEISRFQNAVNDVTVAPNSILVS